MTVTRRTLIAAACIAAATLSGCASFVGPRDVEVPMHRLQAGLEKRFPVHHRALGLFDIELVRPQLAADGQSDRLALTTDLAVTSLLARSGWQGSLTLSGYLKVDNVRNAVYLADARLDNFIVDGMDERTQGRLGAVGNVLADSLIRDLPLYTFKPEDLRYAGVQFQPTYIRATDRGLLIHLEPLSQR
jgi:hypothetical protein